MSVRHLVRIADENAGKNTDIMTWLWVNCNVGSYEELYKHYYDNSGRPSSGPRAQIAYVEFEKEEDAVAFKLEWGN